MRHGSLFSGIGGFDLAAQWMGWENVFQVEWDKWCQKILAKNFPDTLRFGGIVEFNKMLQNGEINSYTNGNSKSNVPINERKRQGQLVKRLGRIDIITGGFPCQPFSHAGKRKGTDDSRYLWPEMLTTIRILKPSFVVGENVAGLVSMENGKTLDGILSDLANEGYTTEQFIIPACSVGAWHRRDRIWIVAYANTAGNEITRQNRKSIKTKGERTTINESIRGRQQSAIQHEGLDDISRNDSNSNGKYRKELFRRNKLEETTGERTFGWGNKINRGQWFSEPNVGRVANGIPNRVDRLKGLGNAIVPQVAFEIFKAIEQCNLELSQSTTNAEWS